MTTTPALSAGSIPAISSSQWTTDELAPRVREGSVEGQGKAVEGQRKEVEGQGKAVGGQGKAVEGVVLQNGRAGSWISQDEGGHRTVERVDLRGPGANMGQNLAGGDSSWCPELESRTTHRLAVDQLCHPDTPTGGSQKIKTAVHQRCRRVQSCLK